MADKKISALTSATTPLDGTEVLPIVQSGATVKVANNDLRPKQIQSNSTSGVLQVTGPAAATTRVMTVPNANFTAARTDAAQSFTGVQTFGSASGQNGVFGTVVGSGGANEGLVIVTSAAGKGWLGFNNANAGTIPGQVTYDFNTNVLDLYSSGTYSFSNGNVTVSTGNVVIGTAGKGIDFSADSHAAGMTSELLDDYEEGTFSPTIASTGGGTPTYVRQLGYYTKIGNRVMFQLLVDLGTKGTLAAGDLSIGSLPYTSNSTIANWPASSIGIYDNITFPAGTVFPTAFVNYNSTDVLIFLNKNGASPVYLTVADINATLRISIAGHYMV